MSRAGSASAARASGPNGTDEWIQVGYSGYSWEESTLYYEVTRPNHYPRYTAVRTVQPGESHGVMRHRDAQAQELVARLGGRPRRLASRSTSPAATAPGSRSRPPRAGTPTRGAATASSTASRTWPTRPGRTAAGGSSRARTSSRTRATASGAGGGGFVARGAI